MSPTICRITAAALLLYFSIATLGKTGSYLDAALCAGVLYAFWLLGKRAAQAERERGE